MITYLRKGKYWKEVVTDGVSLTGNRSNTSFKTLVFPSDEEGRINLRAEKTIWSNGKTEAHNAHNHAVEELKKDGWEEIPKESHEESEK